MGTDPNSGHLLCANGICHREEAGGRLVVEDCWFRCQSSSLARRSIWLLCMVAENISSNTTDCGQARRQTNTAREGETEEAINNWGVMGCSRTFCCRDWWQREKETSSQADRQTVKVSGRMDWWGGVPVDLSFAHYQFLGGTERIFVEY